LVCGDGTNQLNEPGVVAQAVDFLPGAVNAKFAVLLDEGSTSEIQRSEAVIYNVCLQHGAALTEESFTKTFAVGQIGRGKCLESFSVTKSDEVLFTNVWNDGDIGRKVEVDWQRDEFVKGKKILGFNIRHMKNKDDCMFFRAVNERGFQFVEV